MLRNHDSSAIVAVSDIARARAFYADTLGLEVEDEGMEGVLTFRTGATRLIVYRSDEAGTNRANACPELVEGRWSGTSARRSMRSSPRWKRSRSPSNIIPVAGNFRATSTSPEA